MKIAYFDCFSGISGDMVLGALIDAGLDPVLLQDEVAKLGRRDINLAFHATARHAIAATRAEVSIGTRPMTPVEEHHLDVCAVLAKDLDGLCAVLCRHDLVAVLFEEHLGDEAHVLLVVDHEHGAGTVPGLVG